MATCQDCGQEMLGEHAVSCSVALLKFCENNQVIRRDTDYYDYNLRCHDCGIFNNPGNFHHFGCDIERCPICKGQLISCGHMCDPVLNKG